MVRTLENFKKGEKVYVHSTDTREKDFIGYVKSSGKQYVTVACKEDLDWVFGRFNVNNGKREDWSSWELYHSEEEYHTYAAKEKRLKEFRRIADINGFNEMEIETIMNMYEERTKGK